jgi:hypothetical protein
MAVGPIYFQPLTPDQANPGLYRQRQQALIQGQVQNNIARMLQNQALNQQVPYAGQMTQADLQSKLLANQLSGVQLQYAPQQNQSEIALRSAQANAQNALPGLYGAEAGEASARAGLTQQQAALLAKQAPYMVQQEQEKQFTDPVLSRLNQVAVAQRTGAIPSNYLGMVGFGNQASAAAAPSTLPAYLQNQNTAAMTPATAPKAFSGDAATNFALFGSPYNPIQFSAMQKGAETQAATGVSQYNSAQQAAAQSADLGTQVSNLVDQFQNNYKKTDLTGPYLGRSPAVTSAAQATDNASQNIAATVAKLIAGGRVTNYEMQYINTLKPNRTMTPDTAQMTSDFLKQKAVRMQEEQPFLNAARNQGIDIQTANTLWQMYNAQRPVYNFSAQQPNTQFQKTWKDYLAPQAVSAAQNGQNYVPIPSFANKQKYQAWLKTLPPTDKANVLTQIALGGK